LEAKVAYYEAMATARVGKRSAAVRNALRCNGSVMARGAMDTTQDSSWFTVRLSKGVSGY